MNPDILTLVTIFVLAAFVGFEVISKVPSILHTPLMSGTNAIHGVVLVGSMLVLGKASGPVEITLGFIAAVLSTINVVGGFVVTDRMLEMFKGRQPGKPGGAGTSAVVGASGGAGASGVAGASGGAGASGVAGASGGSSPASGAGNPGPGTSSGAAGNP
ncbi:MAG: NAD(P) transhydrogenase subunit alpha [Acidimicrobiales bacterium]